MKVIIAFSSLILSLLIFILMSSFNLAVKVRRASLSSITSNFIPSLTSEKYKGQAGRIAVFGGSDLYTGAPYYAASASLRLGGDLATIFTAKEAEIPIKSYSPELMVQSVYQINDDENVNNNDNEDMIQKAIGTINDMLPRLHSLVIGPGLGRNNRVKKILPNVIQAAIKQEIPIIIDADALFFIQQELSLIKGCKTCILTPNIAEFRRLVDAAITISQDHSNNNNDNNNNYGDDGGNSNGICLDLLHSDEIEKQLYGLHLALQGTPILLKGKYDLLACDYEVVEIREPGSPRRCGGQGDLLAGSLGLTVKWALMNSIPLWQACVLASSAVRAAAKLSFEQHGRGSTTIEILDNISKAFKKIEEDVITATSDTNES